MSNDACPVQIDLGDAHAYSHGMMQSRSPAAMVLSHSMHHCCGRTIVTDTGQTKKISERWPVEQTQNNEMTIIVKLVAHPKRRGETQGRKYLARNQPLDHFP